jgi:hypothetical protein
MIRIALLFAQSDINATLSYQHGWPSALQTSPLFECTPFNLAQITFADRVRLWRMLQGGNFDAIVLLHSVYSNQQNLRHLLFWLVARCPQPKAFFIGNEYKSMPEKVEFCRRLGLDLLISQSNDPHVLDLYRQALGCAVDSIPNTGYDESVFRMTVPLNERPVDIGYRSYEAPWYLGNIEKTEIADHFSDNAGRYGLTTDISLDPNARFDSVEYAAFLNRCRAQIGTESGTDFFELTDETRNAVNAYLEKVPGAPWPEVREKFFDNYGPSVPMRIISGRQVEAAACKTVQVQFDGRYNGYFEADVHYIPLRKDFSNAQEAVDKLRDDAFCARLVDAAYEVASQELTYERLTMKLADSLRRVL